MTQKRADQTQKSQVDKFREAARELKTDDREDAFDAIVRKIAKNPPKSENGGDGQESDR